MHKVLQNTTKVSITFRYAIIEIDIVQYIREQYKEPALFPESENFPIDFSCKSTRT